MKRVIRFLRHHAHHIVFLLSLLSLASLTSWWSVFIHRSIQNYRSYNFELLRSDLRYFSLLLGNDKNNPPSTGTWIQDRRFEIKSTEEVKADTEFSLRLTPYWPQYIIRAHPSIIQEIERKAASLNFMLTGEAGVLILVVLISSVFLYRYIQLERRSFLEAREVWERWAHEIKTPITGIKAFLQNLKSGPCSTERWKTYVDLALKQVRQHEQIAENVITEYSLRLEKAGGRISSIELTSFLSDYFQKASFHLSEAEVRLEVGKDQNLWIKANQHDLKVILDNITDNAVKYTPSRLVLTVKVHVKPKKAIVVIKDNGPGFEPGLSEKIFKAYKYLDRELPPGRHGTGLGLYISRQLARRMGGDLNAFSRGEGAGAEFHIFFQRSEEG